MRDCGHPSWCSSIRFTIAIKFACLHKRLPRCSTLKIKGYFKVTTRALDNPFRFNALPCYDHTQCAGGLLEIGVLASTLQHTCHHGLWYLATHKCTLHRKYIRFVVWDNVVKTENLTRLTEKPLFRDINRLCSSCH